MDPHPVPAEAPERPVRADGGRTRTHELPREEWEPYFRWLSGQYQTTGIRVELEDVPGYGAQTLIERRPLLEIETDLKAGEPRIVLVAGDTEGATPAAIRHVIPRPTRVLVEEAEAGNVRALKFETEGNGSTIVTLGVGEAPLPEGESGLEAALETLQSTP